MTNITLEAAQGAVAKDRAEMALVHARTIEEAVADCRAIVAGDFTERGMRIRASLSKIDNAAQNIIRRNSMPYPDDAALALPTGNCTGAQAAAVGGA